MTVSLAISEVEQSLENVLVFAAGNKIYVLDRDDSVVPVAERNGTVRSLCSHGGVLYDTGHYCQVIATLVGGVAAEISRYGSIRGKKPNGEVVREKNGLFALCSHRGVLYNAKLRGKYIWETMNGKVAGISISDIRSLCSHQGKLYLASDSGVSEMEMGENAMFPGEEVACRIGPSSALCSHTGVLYEATFEGRIIETISGREVAERMDVKALCSHNGRLYDAGLYRKIYDTSTNRDVVTVNEWINALCSCPREDFVQHGILPA